MNRPLINAGIDELREILGTYGDSETVLEQLYAELTHRKTKGARALMAQVSQRLADLEDGDVVDEPGVVDDGPPKLAAKPGETDVQSPIEPSPLKPHPDDQKRPKRLTLMRPPGTAGLKDAYQKKLKPDVTLPVGDDTDLPELYVAALNALIAEIKKSGSGQKRYELQRGALIEIAGNDVLYAFPFTDEADLFEDAQVELQVANRKIEGSIVSVSAGQLIIAVKENLGSDIRQAVLLMDSTALIKALVDKIEQVGNDELAVNRELADAVVGRRPEPIAPPAMLGRTPADLNSSQLRAYDQALSGAITWIWGPPGCGKTKTLGEIVRTAFENERRILISSNTNKAVDQVLYEVCKALGVDHVAMDEGRVVRLGQIADDKLDKEYSNYITVDGIVERRSKELNSHRRQIEEEIERIDKRSERSRKLLEQFDALDRAERIVIEQQDLVGKLTQHSKRAIADLSSKEAKKLKLEGELQSRKNSFLTLFKRSEEIIRTELKSSDREITDAKSTIASTRGDQELARTKVEAAVIDRDQKRTNLASKDRKTADQIVRDAVDLREPLVAELRKIEVEIAALRDSILKNARVLGATCTKAYLSAKDIGQVDMVIIDEASMVMLPMAWFVAGLSRERVVICGDFRQIPPIVPSEQEAIVDVLMPDAFTAAGLREDESRLMMLETQYRMDASICDLISGPMYGGRLKTAEGRVAQKGTLPDPFDQPLTIIDTSDLWPFESQNAFFSRFNLMHALLARNLAWHLWGKGVIATNTDFGICTPYAAQAKLIHKLLEGEQLDQLVQVGTVHRFQGDERRTMLFEIPESHGYSWNLGQFIQGIPPDHVGARLINVAVSRAQDNLIVMSNLTHLDKNLPSGSLLRSILFDMQQQGRVIPGEDILRLRPIDSDLKGLIDQIPLEEITKTLGIFDETAFERALICDIQSAKETVVIFSGYVTPGRVSKLGDLFRSKVAQGVKIRCVTRPPQTNGSILPEYGREALDMLEGIGVVVDCRANIHQKVCLIDNRIVWLGSLNALSHAGRSDETMTRAVNEGYAQAIAAHMSKRRISADKAAKEIAEPENPRCPDCGSRTVYSEGKPQYGPYYFCEQECGWKLNQKRFEQGGTDGFKNNSTKFVSDLPKKGPACPLCNSETQIKSGPYGKFYGCTKYPSCKGKVNADKPKKVEKPKTKKIKPRPKARTKKKTA